MADMKVSSINPVLEASRIPSANNFEPSMPLIPRMIKLHISLGKTGDIASHNFIDRLEGQRIELKAWSKKEMDYLMDVANRSWLEQGWAVVKTVADCLISVVSFALGGYFLATGNSSTGNLLIAGGIFNILQTVFARQGMWDWISETLAEKNDAVKERLKLAFPIIISVLGLGFTIATSRTTQDPNAVKKILEGFQGFVRMGGQVISTVLSIQKGFDDARAPAIQGELEKSKQNLDLLSRLLDYCMKETRRIKLKKPITALIQATTLAAQKV